MKHTFFIFLLLIFVSCQKPDLTVVSHTAVWTEDAKNTTAYIVNTGDTTAYNFNVLLDFKEDPISGFDPEPVTFGPYTLYPRDTISIYYDLLPFAREENNYLRNINLIFVSVDHNNIIDEIREDNNRSLFTIP